MFPWFTLLLSLVAVGINEISLIEDKQQKSFNVFIILSIVSLGVLSLVYNPKSYERAFYENYNND